MVAGDSAGGNMAAATALRIRDEGEGVERIDFSRKIVEEQNLDEGMHRGFGMYLISAIGITIGYHRLFCHRAFKTPRFIQAIPSWRRVSTSAFWPRSCAIASS